VLDHVSASWSVDETVSVADSQNITLQWSIVSEPLNESVHSEGPHGKCSLIRGSEYVTVYRTLFAHCPDRSPHFSGKRVFQPKMQAVNNLVFDYGESAVKIEAKDDPFKAVGLFDVVGNYFIGGPKSRYEIAVKKTLYGASVFVAGNIGPNRASSGDDEWKVVKTEGSPRSELEVSSPSLRTISGAVNAEAARDSVLQFAGTVLPQRDAVDLRVVQDVQQRRTGYLNSQSAVGGWPTLVSTNPPVDSDGDGMPDQWELATGLDPADPADGRRISSSGYSHLENYLNALVTGAFPR
jgi:large repetitive protein